MKYLVVGLGNPGAEYAGTRHNAGFMVLDRLVDRSGTSFATARLGEVAEVRHRGRTLILLKPSTFMNLSGKAVRYWMQKEGVPLERVLVVVDDLAIPLGAVRLRAKGSDAGHNGLKDIQAQLQSSAYARLRIGIGNDFPRGRQVDFVLERFSSDEMALLSPALDRAVEGVEMFCTVGAARAMNTLNTTKGS